MIAGIVEESLDRPFEYRDFWGDRCETQLRLVLGHFFNHQTHHRGQVHDMLSQTGVPPPSLDLIDFVRQGLTGATAEASG